MTLENDVIQIQTESLNAKTRLPKNLDYNKVRRYWNQVRPSVLGPYMMDGFGFPMEAGKSRIKGEREIVDAFVKEIPPTVAALDLGSGMGYWTDYFAKRFNKVISVESSTSLYKGLLRNVQSLSNVKAIHTNVLKYKPDEKFGVVFLGGLLMYLNEPDVAHLLRNISTWLIPGGIIICRESTVRHGTVIHQNDYQVVYRSTENYRRTFSACGLQIVHEQPNAAYISPQMACELVKKWKAVIPKPLWCLPVCGRAFYWFSRLGYPGNARYVPKLLEKVGIEFPKLTNHFFLLRPQEE